MKAYLAVAIMGPAILAQSCGGGSGIYPDTDVVAVSDFELKGATDVQKSDGQLQSGTLTYEGEGNLVEIFHAYLAAMKKHGWDSQTDNIGTDKAIGTMRKKNRTCALDFVSVSGVVRATVKVSLAK